MLTSSLPTWRLESEFQSFPVFKLFCGYKQMSKFRVEKKLERPLMKGFSICAVTSGVECFLVTWAKPRWQSTDKCYTSRVGDYYSQIHCLFHPNTLCVTLSFANGSTFALSAGHLESFVSPQDKKLFALYTHFLWLPVYFLCDFLSACCCCEPVPATPIHRGRSSSYQEYLNPECNFVAFAEALHCGSPTPSLLLTSRSQH